MAVPVVEAYTFYNDISNSATRTINKPPGTTSGEWLVFWGGLDGNTGLSISGSFTSKFTRADAEYSSWGLLAVRKVDGTEGSNFTVSTGSGSEEGTGVLMRISGIDSGITAATLLDAISIVSADCTNAKVTVPGFYCETNDALAVCAFIMDAGVSNTSGSGTPSGYTEIYQAAGLAASTGISVCTKSITSAGYVAPVEFGVSASSDAFIAVHFAIRSNTTIQAYPSEAFLKETVIDCPTSASSTIDIDIPLPPSTVQDDGLILQASAEVANGLNTLPSDFTQIDLSNTGGAIYSYAGKFIADASMPTSYTINSTVTSAKIGALHLFRNIDTSDFVHKDAVTTGTTDAAPTAPSVTTTKDNCLILRTFSADDDDATVNGGYFSGSTGIFSLTTLANADISMQAARSVKATAGSTGTDAATLGAAEEWVARTLAIAPAVTGSALVEVRNESNSISESVSWVKAIKFAINESNSTSEALAKALSLCRINNESLSLAEQILLSMVLIQVKDESEQSSEAVSPQVGLIRLIAEDLELGEAFENVLGKLAIVDESVEVSENLLSLLGLIREIAESSSISESLGVQVSLNRLVQESSSLSEQVLNLMSLTRSLNESLSLSEDHLTQVGLNRTINETLEISELVEYSISTLILVSVDEGLSLSETLELITGLVKLVDESLDNSESTAVAISLLRAVNETLSITESTQPVLQLLRIISETLEISETVSFTELLIRTIGESLGLTETVDTSRLMIRLVDESTGIVEALSTAKGLAIIIDESVDITESLESVKGLLIEINESLSQSETTLYSLELLRLIDEASEIAESWSLAQDKVRFVEENQSLVETLVTSLIAIRLVNEVNGIAESVTLSQALVRAVAEVCNVAESVVHVFADLIRSVAQLIGSYLTQVSLSASSKSRSTHSGSSSTTINHTGSID